MLTIPGFSFHMHHHYKQPINGLGFVKLGSSRGQGGTNMKGLTMIMPIKNRNYINTDIENHGTNNINGDAANDVPTSQEGILVYKVYKRRWFGLLQLTLMNIIVSWDVSLSLVFLFPHCVYNQPSISFSRGDVLEGSYRKLGQIGYDAQGRQQQNAGR